VQLAIWQATGVQLCQNVRERFLQSRPLVQICIMKETCAASVSKVASKGEPFDKLLDSKPFGEWFDYRELLQLMCMPARPQIDSFVRLHWLVQQSDWWTHWARSNITLEPSGNANIQVGISSQLVALCLRWTRLLPYQLPTSVSTLQKCCNSKKAVCTPFPRPRWSPEKLLSSAYFRPFKRSFEPSHLISGLSISDLARMFQRFFAIVSSAENCKFYE
jgi:hypothetical protein